MDDVLEMVTEMYQYEFDFRKPTKHSMAQLKTMATRLKPFGINPAKPELTLILIANITTQRSKTGDKNSVPPCRQSEKGTITIMYMMQR